MASAFVSGSDDHIDTLISEVNHRANNLLAVIRGIILMSQGEGVDDLRQSLTGRLDALSAANALIASNRWHDVDFSELVRQQLQGYGWRISISGEDFHIRAKSAQNFGMFLHELATNAQRHGALSAPHGRVDLTWTHSPEQFIMQWTEKNGPKVEVPAQQKLGLRVISTGMRQFGGSVVQEWRPEGLVCIACCPSTRL